MSGIKSPNGITAETYQRLATDAGAVYVDYGLPGETLIGATRGGNTFTIEDDIREMLADGAPGPIRGSQRRIRSVAKLTVNLLEITTANLKSQLPGSVSAVDSGTHDKITRSAQIAAGDYFDNVTLVVAKNGDAETFALQLDRAIALNGLEWAANEDDETVIAMEFTAHFDPDALGTEPWSIYNPLEGGVTKYTLTYTAGDNGSIIGDGSQSVADGEDGTAVYANADSGYQFSAWSDASTDNPRTDTSVSADVTVSATFTTV